MSDPVIGILAGLATVAVWQGIAWWYRRQRREQLRVFMREMRREWEDLTGVDREWKVEE